MLREIKWRDQEISQFVLGTVQLGVRYGIANITGKPSREESFRIIATCLDQGVNGFDTAQDYGESEEILGMSLNCLDKIKSAKVISKLSVHLNPIDTNAISKYIERSRKQLQTQKIWGMMLHSPIWLDYWEQGLGRVLLIEKEKGGIEYLGVSVYSVADAIRALKHPDIDIIQVPCNAWDQRMIEEGILDVSRRMNKLCFARSILLQGLLGMTPVMAEKRLPGAGPAVTRWIHLAKEMECTPLELSIRFGLSLDCPLVIGVFNVAQVSQILSLMSLDSLNADTIERIKRDIKPYLQDALIEPMKWGKVGQLN